MLVRITCIRAHMGRLRIGYVQAPLNPVTHVYVPTRINDHFHGGDERRTNVGPDQPLVA